MGAHVSGASSCAKRALCKQKRGTLQTKFVKKWGHVPPLPPVPKSMIEIVMKCIRHISPKLDVAVISIIIKSGTFYALRHRAPLATSTKMT